jgi:cellobiose phosphorylase
MDIDRLLARLSWRHWPQFGWRNAPRKFEYEPALRSELFSAEQMERYGAQLAQQHRLSSVPGPDLLLARLADNEILLISSCKVLTAASRSPLRITPAGEWLLDNYYLIEEQVRTAQKHLPKGYSRALPRLANGPSAGLPRVYDIALEVISHGDGRVDEESLSRFVASYQSVMPLTLGELWAIPIMLRLALLENLRRIAARVMSNWNDRKLAVEWAERMTQTAEHDPKSVVLMVADMARSDPPMVGSFVAELARRLQGQSAALALPLTWIEQRLSESGRNVEHMVQAEAQQQAAEQVSIGNSIGSLRQLAGIDWRQFVENTSVVERMLRKDPAAVYATMDFSTRDHYRHRIEQLARRCGQAEPAVAAEVIALAQAGAGVQAHVGYYLIDRGQVALRRQLAVRPSITAAWRRALERAPLPIYLGLIGLLTLGFALPFLDAARLDGWPPGLLLLLLLPTVLMTSRLGLALVNWLMTLTVTPTMLPRLDYQDGIPGSARTLVVVPTLIGSAQDVEELIEGLEVRYLANRDPHLHFGLLTDFMDAASEHLPQDAALLALAQMQLEALNRKYPAAPGEHFFLFHRPRRWNPSEGVWMGYERKRGKLSELNALLRGQGRERFALIVGDLAVLQDVRYVITLDTDTQLPRDAARQFVGAMEHPLNRPVYDDARHRVVSGYAILQPRVGISLQSTARSAYANLFGSEAGIDPYTRIVSDIYQDLFRQGSFIGKGIYAVDAFEQAIEGRFADNRILSHDLIEGCYARSGLLSDVQLYEEYPARYSTHVSREHRWLRGDWQLLPWMLPWAPVADGRWQRNRLCALSRWKIFDNLRRSLEPLALLSMLLIGWFGVLQTLSWSTAILSLVFILPLLASLLELFQKPAEVALSQHLAVASRSAGQHLLRAVLGLVWLPHEVLSSVDAIVRTLWRMLVSRRHLLQWSTSREVERRGSRGLWGHYRTMWFGPLLGGVVAVALWPQPLVLLLAAPLLLAWLLSPAIAWRISQPSTRAQFRPSPAERAFLGALSRRIWAFFDQHVGPDDHWLPPDNMQEQPVAVVAHRTSPTNMGLGLLAHLAAFDFGYLSAGRLLRRLDAMLGSMAALERHRGHFYNWYDTQTLQPLPPRYISTVDSGNLAGHLMTLRPGLLALADAPVFSVDLLRGLASTLEVLRQTLEGAAIAPGALTALQAELDAALAAPPQSLAAAARRMQALLSQAQALQGGLRVEPQGEVAYWLGVLLAQCEDLAEEASYGARLPERLAGGQAAPGTIGGLPNWRELAQLDVTLWPQTERAGVLALKQRALQRLATIERLVTLVTELAWMDFSFLYNRKRDLFSIGYNMDEGRLDAGFYDLLASEARLTNFVVIAQGQLPQESWFTLGRLLTSVAGAPVLLSWSGSLFEYLMPMLVMPSYAGTLLDQTCHAAVARQIEYGQQLGLPWGVSESGYNALDAQLNYQYRAFGVPGLGLKRGLGEDLVVAPYASTMALMVAPQAATRNLQRLSEDGLAGRYGLYEAIDYTPARVPLGQRSVIVASFMAHHQGMSLLALASVLLNRPMQRRFLSDPQFQATILLLQERVPKTAAEYLHAAAMPIAAAATRVTETKLRVLTDPDRRRPAVQLLSNGRYHVMVSSAGGGYSRCRELAVTRWREDLTCDNWGMFCYLRDVASGAFWSTAHQPTLQPVEHYEAIFSDARAEFRVRQHSIDAHTEIVVSPEDDIELRRVHLTNRSRVRRTIELTSYAEVVLAPALADAMHPAFSNLFVQTELVQPLQAILCSRRPRASQEPVPWLCHLLAVHGAHVEAVSYETDRARFIGRGRSLIDPAAMDQHAGGDGRLSDTAGSVLDPIVAIRCRLVLEPNQSVTVDLVTGMANDRQGCLQLIGKYRDRHLADRVFDLAWTHSQVLLRQLNASLDDARLYEQMAASILYANASLRAEASVLSANQRDQSGLWGQAISGDRPIVLLQIGDSANIELVRQLVQAHAYWRLKGLTVDLVIWNEDHAGYRQQLQDLIMGLIASGAEANLLDRPGGIFVRPAQQLSREDRILTQSVARIVLSDTRGSLDEQIRRRWAEKPLPRFDPLRLRDEATAADAAQLLPARLAALPASLQLGNSYGGFSADGSEYVIELAPGQHTPAPWSNVLANPQFGTVISESGSAYSWAENAHEFRLTPWANDPVGDPGGEAIYLRDEDSGRYWSPTPLPRRGQGYYRTRHGFGYSVFEHEQDGIHSELWVYVAIDAPVKFSVLKIRNRSGRSRRLSATGYVEWQLGDLREKSAMHVVTEPDPVSGALLARNAYLMAFPGRVAFFDVDAAERSVSGDRSEFLGRNGSLRAPAAMAQPHLSGRTGAGLDPCGAIRVDFALDAGDSHELVFRLGAGTDSAQVGRLLQRWRGSAPAADALEAVHAHWRWTLGKVQVNTPDLAVNLLANGWLMYQVIASRFWARSGYYQSGGAFGFRDQLQDSMAMIHAAPYAARQHLLLCAAHQFVEGDVQHWWHPPQNRGVRTGCSDDYLWLALATSHYVRGTGDTGVLDETVGYIQGRALHPGEESYYDLPQPAPLSETLYQHCVRAIEFSMPRGEHGLPLIGAGDWNDGMNRVGEQGRGESIWLGFFLYEVLRDFAGIARLHADEPFVLRCESTAAALQTQLEQHGWDGAWYRRAYFDDGTPLGSSSNDDCQIDSIAQSWSVLSGAAPGPRQRQAMASLNRRLVRRDLNLVQLLDPPFDESALDPGYIKGYLPGVRENGGQYTHAAVWAAMAYARLGDSAHAWELAGMINPLNHTRDAEGVAIYKVEPYVMAADVYGVAPHGGRGGWSWYTGSAGWMYRLLTESLLGLSVRGETLTINPVLPAAWREYTLDYRFRETDYHFTVRQLAADDPAPLPTGAYASGQPIALIDDGGEHHILVHHRSGRPAAEGGRAET